MRRPVLPGAAEPRQPGAGRPVRTYHVVLTGSYNCSRGGNDNAENVLHIESAEFADRFSSYADEIAARYHGDPSRKV